MIIIILRENKQRKIIYEHSKRKFKNINYNNDNNLQLINLVYKTNINPDKNKS